MNARNRSSTDAEGDEVEAMLCAAEDALLLKLSVNGHMAHQSSSDLPTDLSHRFQSLKSGSSSSKSPSTSTNTSFVRSEVAPAAVSDDPDDLFARFAALKASLPKPSFAASSSFYVDPVKDECCERRNQLSGDNKLAMESELDQNHEDEVDKIIRWAVDAARLDPSPESDDDGDEAVSNDSDSDTDSCQEDDDDDHLHQKKK